MSIESWGFMHKTGGGGELKLSQNLHATTELLVLRGTGIAWSVKMVVIHWRLTVKVYTVWKEFPISMCTAWGAPTMNTTTSNILRVEELAERPVLPIFGRLRQCKEPLETRGCCSAPKRRSSGENVLLVSQCSLQGGHAWCNWNGWSCHRRYYLDRCCGNWWSDRRSNDRVFDGGGWGRGVFVEVLQDSLLVCFLQALWQSITTEANNWVSD